MDRVSLLSPFSKCLSFPTVFLVVMLCVFTTASCHILSDKQAVLVKREPCLGQEDLCHTLRPITPAWGKQTSPTPKGSLPHGLEAAVRLVSLKPLCFISCLNQGFYLFSAGLPANNVILTSMKTLSIRGTNKVAIALSFHFCESKSVDPQHPSWPCLHQRVLISLSVSSSHAGLLVSCLSITSLPHPLHPVIRGHLTVHTPVFT